MIRTPSELSKLLKSTVLADSNIAWLEIPESIHSALAIEIPRKTKFDSWRLLRLLVDITGRYPILTDPISYSTGNWKKDLIEADFFSRFYYEEEREYGYLTSVVPESIIDAAASLDGEKAIKSRVAKCTPMSNEKWIMYDWFYQYLKQTKSKFSVSPSPEKVERVLNSDAIITEIDFEWWLFDWELNNVPKEQLLKPPNLSYLELFDCFSSETTTMLLLPTPNSWDILAYIHFWGAINSAEAIAILKYWHDKYGAELIASYNTILEFNVQQKPTTPKEAFNLASQHYQFAPCTLLLPHTSIREYALELMYANHWSLHERP